MEILSGTNEISFHYSIYIFQCHSRICRYYRESHYCYRGQACPDLHVYTGPGCNQDGKPVHLVGPQLSIAR